MEAGPDIKDRVAKATVAKGLGAEPAERHVNIRKRLELVSLLRFRGYLPLLCIPQKSVLNDTSHLPHPCAAQLMEKAEHRIHLLLVVQHRNGVASVQQQSVHVVVTNCLQQLVQYVLQLRYGGNRAEAGPLDRERVRSGLVLHLDKVGSYLHGNGKVVSFLA